MPEALKDKITAGWLSFSVLVAWAALSGGVYVWDFLANIGATKAAVIGFADTSQIAELDKSIKGLASAVDRGFAGVKEEVGVVRGELATIRSEIGTFRERMAAQEARMGDHILREAREGYRIGR